MRRRVLAAVLAAWGLAAGLMHSQPPGPPPAATHRAGLAHNVEVRAGPSWQFAATGTLERGAEVEVLSEENGWLTIRPPAGSCSWVADRFLKDPEKPTPGVKNAIIAGDVAVPVRVGRTGFNQPLPIEAPVRLQRGTIVVLLGQQVTFEDTTWQCIQPTDSEVRYVPKEALDEKAELPPVPGVPKSQGPLIWAQAEQAERAGNLAEAEQLYQQLADELARSNGDQELLLRCHNRIQQIRDRQRATASPPATPVSRTSGTTIAATAERSTSSPASGYTPAAPSPGAGPMHSSGPGWLRRTGFLIAGQRAYVLENGQGLVRLYVVPQTGVNLDPYLNQRVDLIGPLVPRTDVRGSIMVVHRVNPVR